MNRLLKLLSTNARMSNAQLAVLAGCTEEEAASQIEAWERSGVIRGYNAVIDWERADCDCVTARIELKVSPCRDLGFEGIAETIMRFDEVDSVYLMSGGYDIAVTVSGHSFKDVAMFVSHRLAPMDSVLSTATHFVLRKYKSDGVLLFDEDKDERGAL